MQTQTMLQLGPKRRPVRAFSCIGKSVQFPELMTIEVSDRDLRSLRPTRYPIPGKMVLCGGRAEVLFAAEVERTERAGRKRLIHIKLSGSVQYMLDGKPL